MVEIMEYLKARYMSQKAQGIVEYALILAFVVVIAAAIASGGDLQGKVSSVFKAMNDKFGN